MASKKKSTSTSGSRKASDREIAREARFFMADASEADARADDARRKRERARARRSPAPVSRRTTKSGQTHKSVTRSQGGMTYQCQDCNAIMFPLGKPNPHHQLRQSEAFAGTSGVSHGLCSKCGPARQRFNKRYYAPGVTAEERKRIAREEDERLASLNATYRDDPHSSRNKTR